MVMADVSNNVGLLFFQRPLRSVDLNEVSLLLSKSKDEVSEEECFHRDGMIRTIQHPEISQFNGGYYFGFSALDDNILVGSCNGLVCIQCCDSFFLWNPHIKEVNLLPKFPFRVSYLGKFYGFGYDSTTDDYKIVLGKPSYNPVSSSMSVFSVKSNSWKSVEGLQFMRLAGQACFLNGALHWLEANPYDGRSLPIKRTPRFISFDLALEKFKKFPIYHVVGDDTTFTALQIGTTAATEYTKSRLFVSSYCCSSYEVPIWVMQEYGDNKSWTKFMQIRLLELPMDSLAILSVSENGEALVNNERYLLLYNSENKARVSFDLYKDYDNSRVMCEPSTYIKTYVSPFSGKEPLRQVLTSNTNFDFAKKRKYRFEEVGGCSEGCIESTQTSCNELGKAACEVHGEHVIFT